MKILCSKLPADMLNRMRQYYAAQWYKYTEEQLKCLHLTIAFRQINGGKREFRRQLDFGERPYQRGRYMRTIPVVMDIPIGLYGTSDA